MLSEDQLTEYLAPLTSDQAAVVKAVRAMILETDSNFVEAVDQGKWFGGLLTYHTADGTFYYALGPRKSGDVTLHMMAYYVSTELQQRHGVALKYFLNGKSCMRIGSVAEIPESSLRDIFQSAPDALKKAQELMDARKAKKAGK